MGRPLRGLYNREFRAIIETAIFGDCGGAMADRSESRELYLKGISWWNKKRYDNALFCFQKAYELQPDNPFIASYLGLALVKMKSHDQGLALCREAMRKRPFNEELVFNLGQACMLAGRRNEARKVLLLGAKGCDDHQRFLNALKEMGVRRRPVIRFLSRDHALNKWLGRMTYRPGTFRIEDIEN
jgi:tetratricopeptide (TPR) repeat protein